MVMSAPAAPAAATGTGTRPTGPARRRPGEFGGGSRKFTPRRKVCQFCVDKIKEVDYKDLSRLRRFLSERGKIEPRRKTGTCAAHQRSLNVALKRARQLALLPFTAEHIRVTGVLVREPGAPPFRGARPRPTEYDGTGEAPAAADGAATDGQTPSGEAAAAASATQSEPTAEAATGVAAAQAEAPAAQAEAPAAQVEAPAARVETPAEHAEAPATQAEAPAAQAEASTAQPEVQEA
jgi:small subunit ribosomal protein S18